VNFFRRTSECGGKKRKFVCSSLGKFQLMTQWWYKNNTQAYDKFRFRTVWLIMMFIHSRNRNPKSWNLRMDRVSENPIYYHLTFYFCDVIHLIPVSSHVIEESWETRALRFNWCALGIKCTMTSFPFFFFFLFSATLLKRFIIIRNTSDERE